MKMNEVKQTKEDAGNMGGDIPHYLMDRKHEENGQLLSTTIKQKRLEKAVLTTIKEASLINQ